MYEYAARMISFPDADTVRFDVDQGLDHHTYITIRLSGVDAYEISTDKGKEARDWVARWFATKPVVRLFTIKDKKEKYGRYLGVVEPWEGGESLNTALVRLGYAVPYDGGKRG